MKDLCHKFQSCQFFSVRPCGIISVGKLKIYFAYCPRTTFFVFFCFDWQKVKMIRFYAFLCLQQLRHTGSIVWGSYDTIYNASAGVLYLSIHGANKFSGGTAHFRFLCAHKITRSAFLSSAVTNREFMGKRPLVQGCLTGCQSNRQFYCAFLWCRREEYQCISILCDARKKSSLIVDYFSDFSLYTFYYHKYEYIVIASKLRRSLKRNQRAW